MNSCINSRNLLKHHYRKLGPLLVAGLFIGFSPVQAEDCWKIAPGRTKVEFKVKHLVFMSVNGRFKDIKGCVDTHGLGFDGASAQATIEVESIYTGNENRDEHLRSPDFFTAAQFPEMTFKSVTFRGSTKKDYAIDGELCIRGTTKPIKLKAVFDSEKELSGDRTRVIFNVSGTLNRFDYGLRWNGTDELDRALVGNEIEVAVKLVLIKTSGMAFHGHMPVEVAGVLKH